MSIYKLSNKGIEEIPTTTFQENGILEREHLQNYLRDNIDIISENTLVISEEFSYWNESKRRIDILGIDKEANLIVIELKRTESGDHMELQAIRYASMISTINFQQCVNIYQQYLDKRNFKENALENLLEFLEWNEPLEEDFALDIKIVLASADFSKELTTSVLWLIEKGIDITCVKIKPYKFENELLLNINQIIPLPETENYLIKVKEKSTERINAINSKKDTTKYLFNGKYEFKNRLVLEIVREYVSKNPNKTYEEILNRFPKELQGSVGVINKIDYINEKYALKKDKRHFLKIEDILKSKDEVEFAVCTQWSIGNIPNILNVAEEENYNVTE